MNDNDYSGMFKRFFESKHMTSTYKPVFLRALLDLGTYEIHGPNHDLVGKQWIEINGDEITLDLNFIVTRFIKYYWDMDHSFKLRHAHSPKDAAVVRIIQEQHALREYRRPPTLEEIAEDDNKELRQEVIQLSIKRYLLDALISKKMIGLFKRQRGTSKIKLETSIISFLREHRTVIRNGLNYKLTTYLEKHNASIPQIAAKIDDENYPSRKLDKISEELIDIEQKNRCFYCDVKYEVKKRDIDHVIPYNYIFATKMYNCVGACIRCNRTKSDNLPKREFFKEVIERNNEFASRTNAPLPIKNTISMYNEEWYKRTYNNCIVDYHGPSAPFFRP